MLKQPQDNPGNGRRQSPFDRIILTGFRATGKSLVGGLLAERLGQDFLDTDRLLCARSGLSVQTFVDRYGWLHFRRQEERLLLSLKRRSSVVIATGGGAVLHEQAWRSLRKKSIVFWLHADFSTIEKRMLADVQSPRQRPSLTGGDCIEEIREMLVIREPLYRQGSDHIIITDDRQPLALVREIEQVLAGEGPCSRYR